MTRSDRRLRALAVAITVLALMLTCAAFFVHASWSSRLQLRPLHAGDVVLATMFPAAGLLVLWQRPRNAAGWVLLSGGLVSVSLLAHQWSDVALQRPGTLPWVSLAIWLSAWTFFPYWAQPSLLPVLFPDGRLPSRAWRRYLQVTVVLVVVLALAAMFKVDDDVEGLGGTNPLGQYWLFERLPAMTGPALQYGSGLVLWLICSPIAVIGLLRRQRRASGVERAQLQWLLLGLLGCVLLSVADALVGGGGDAVFAAGFALVPISVAVAVLRHGLFDVAVVVPRAVSYALLTGASLLAYVALVAAAGRYVGGEGVGPVVAALVVAGAASARTRVQRLVERRVFGARRDPYALVQQVGTRTAEAAGPTEALQALVDAVRSTLRLPFVQVLDDRGEVAAESGAAAVGTSVVPIVVGGRQAGVLVVGRRSRRERLGERESSALAEVARRAGALLTARQLTDDLERSYAEVLSVRESERRRLRADLHDGVGPALAGVALQLEGLAGRLADPALAARAQQARARLLTTVADVRRLIEGLSPADLEEHGLAAALQRLATTHDDRVLVTVTTDLPHPLPAEVESAAYRIAGESVANALRHAAAGQVRVQARMSPEGLVLEVEDDGTGLPVPLQPGVGLRSMQERAVALGGRLDVRAADPSGTRVRAVLPVTVDA